MNRTTNLADGLTNGSVLIIATPHDLGRIIERLAHQKLLSQVVLQLGCAVNARHLFAANEEDFPVLFWMPRKNANQAITCGAVTIWQVHEDVIMVNSRDLPDTEIYFYAE